MGGLSYNSDYSQPTQPVLLPTMVTNAALDRRERGAGFYLKYHGAHSLGVVELFGFTATQKLCCSACRFSCHVYH